MPKLLLQHKHIEVFRAVMRTKSATGAGRLLSLTQPGVSKLLIQAEELCGFSLFERLHGRLIPTTRALSLFEETERMFVGMDEISRLIERVAADEPPRSYIATVSLLGQTLIPDALSTWLPEMGGRMAVTTRDNGGVLALVAARRAELGLVAAFDRLPGVKSMVIARCRAMVAVPDGHPLLDKDVITAADFQDQPYIGLSRYEGMQTVIDEFFRAANVRPREIVECPVALCAAAMASKGIGLTFVDAFTARDVRGKGVQMRRFESPIIFEYRAIWPEGQRSTFDRPAFLNHLVEAANAIIADDRGLLAPED